MLTGKTLISQLAAIIVLSFHFMLCDAQTNVTSKIKNPSFENGFTSWTNVNMQTQSNSDFTKKAGTYYAEKWTSSGNKIGDAEVSQTIKSLPAGAYELTVAAQNIQQNSSKAQTGAWIFANDARNDVNARNDYKLSFINIENDVTIGFKAEGATGNWIAVDNFRLTFTETDISVLREELQSRIDNAKTLSDEKMNKDELAALLSAISKAEAVLGESTADNYPGVATPLRNASKSAQTSVDAYKELLSAISAAEKDYGDGTGKQAEDYLAAINHARETYNSDGSSISTLAQEVENLSNAAFAYRIANGSGAAPSVITDTRYARGSNVIFGRSKVSGTNILEEGFCWSTEPNPTVLDGRSTQYISHNGKIFKMTGLKPSTKYYVRAYAISKDYAVGYGDVIKVYTIPKGNVTYWYNNGGNAEENARISSALNVAVNQYWNNLTSIKGYNVSCSYGSGTPTADCSYGGSMRVGPNSSYQQPGTIMHEMNHGIGGGTTDIWKNSCMRENRSRGHWLGERANAVIRFWDNDESAWVTGDDTHFWPYGINGAQEDDHSESTYTCSTLINQGFCEDGLVPVNYWSGGFCLPAYSFEHEDGVKYYIKNESPERGLTTSYLVMDGTKLKWVEMTAAELTDNDNAAWTITFDPVTCYYQIQNVGTGNYIKNGTNNNIHIMKGRVDVKLGSSGALFTTRGYWLIYASNHSVLTANANGATGTSSFSLENSATTQRWLILTADETRKAAGASIDDYKNELAGILDGIEKLVSSPHEEKTEGINQKTLQSISDLRSQAETVTVTSELAALITDARKLCKTFCSGVSSIPAETPFDVTFLLKNPSLRENTDGWDGTTPTTNFNVCEYYMTAFDFNQTMTDVARGFYTVKMQGFQRPGSAENVYSAYLTGTDDVNAILYANKLTGQPICNIASEAQDHSIGGNESKVGKPTFYIPNDMESAQLYFNAGLFDNAYTFRIYASNLTIGLKGTAAGNYYWTAFSNFRLYFHADTDPTGIEQIEPAAMTGEDRIFNLQGQRISEKQMPATKGIYIKNGKKFLNY